MAFQGGIPIILIISTRVEDKAIVQELDVAGLELHIEIYPWTSGNFIER